MIILCPRDSHCPNKWSKRGGKDLAVINTSLNILSKNLAVYSGMIKLVQFSGGWSGHMFPKYDIFFDPRTSFFGLL